jgi:hypothetical protein
MRKILGGLFEFEILRGMWLDRGMAKYIQPSFNTYSCPRCNTAFDVRIEQIEPDPWMPAGTPITRNTVVQKQCMCAAVSISSGNQPATRKETTVAKTFDTTANKSAALNTIQSRVEQVERALFDRVEARIKLETEHTAIVAEASAKLNRALADSLQVGMEEEDLENFLPEYDEYLTERLNTVAQEMSLANVLEGV